MRLLLILGAGCGGGTVDSTPVVDDGDADTDSDADADADADADTDADTDTTPPTGETGITTPSDWWTSTLPDPGPTLDVDICDAGVVANNATAWFVGDFTVSGTVVTGTEVAVVHWSDDVVADCGYAPDCVIAWDVTSGATGAVGGCATCDFGMTLTVEVDMTATTCPTERILDFGAGQLVLTYDVRANGDGTSDFHFSGSGNLLGSWYWSGSEYSYVAEQAYCVPYPDDLSAVCP